MCQEARSTADLKAFEEALAAAVAKARSLDEFAAWLRSQPGVTSVQVAGYLLKSNPPQRDIIVALNTVHGEVRKIVNVFELDNHQFEFHKLRDQ